MPRLVQAVRNVQASWRGMVARRALAESLQAERGVLLALPGTIQSQSGWYETVVREADGKVRRMAIEFRVAGGRWSLAHEPVDMKQYLRLRNEGKEEETEAAASGHAGVGQDVGNEQGAAQTAKQLSLEASLQRYFG